MSSALEMLAGELERLDRFPSVRYRIPGAWVGSDSCVELDSAASFFRGLIDDISSGRLKHQQSPGRTFYNAMVRHVTSYDHGTEASRAGWRSTGTFLKMMALLPYLTTLDVGTIVLLPINTIGRVGQKGSIGSPYSVRDPFAVEPALAEPLLLMTPEQQARAFVDAAHCMGMRVVSEVVLRTASLDSVLVADHPEWFYWIHRHHASTFTAPVFSAEQSRRLRADVEAGCRSHLPEPSIEYRRQFTEPPVRLHPTEHGWNGVTSAHDEVTIPGAFADWPVDDPQPAWTDVTYLKLHHHTDFNYMAYNTIRMFDQRIDVPEMAMQGAWNAISAVIPSQMRMLGTDGAMIDMGHALPSSLRRQVIEHARQQRPDALMIEENFHIDAASLRDGFDVVTGYLPFDVHTAGGLRAFVERIAHTPLEIRCFAWGESHNTARMAQRMHPDAVAPAWLLLGLLPRTVPCIVSGMELGETRPMNTGLGFTEQQIRDNPPSKLALFSDVPLPWDSCRPHLERMRQLIALAHGVEVVSLFTDDDTIVVLTCHVPEAVSFHRRVRGSRRGAGVILNVSEQPIELELDIASCGVTAVAVDVRWKMDGAVLRCRLPAHGIAVIPTYCDAGQGA